MQIQSIIEREGGTEILMDDIRYAFVPDESGKHVCDVENEEHMAKFLSITEGFKVVVETKKTAKKLKPNDSI